MPMLPPLRRYFFACYAAATMMPRFFACCFLAFFDYFFVISRHTRYAIDAAAEFTLMLML